MLIILTSRQSRIVEWLKKYAGYRIVESNWQMLQGGHDNEENWLPCGGGSNGKQKLFHLEKSTIKEFFPHLSDWIPSDDDNLPILCLAMFNSESKEDIRHALVTMNGSDICVVDFLHADTSSFGCREASQNARQAVVHCQSYRLRKAPPTPLSRPLKSRTIYLSRHGESEYNVLGRVGGNSGLSARGRQYGQKLGEYFNKTAYRPDLRVWTSSLKRTIETAQAIEAAQEQLSALDELGSGVCDGMTYEEIAREYPLEFAARDEDKFAYRYPGGESYADLVLRVEPIVKRLVDEDNVLVIAHQAVLRCVIAVLLSKDERELPYIHAPLHTVMKMTYTEDHGWHLDFIPLAVECVDTHRAKPQNCCGNRTAEEALVTVPAHFSSNVFESECIDVCAFQKEIDI